MNLENKIPKKILPILYILIILVLILIGAWLRVSNLGEVDFQNDEFFHLDTAVGYMETGKFVMWDFLEQEQTGDYIRAFPYTWLVAQSFGFFGMSETTGRLPSAIFGILLLPLIYFVTYKITGNKLVSLLVLVLIVFDNSFIWSSRICRMYSMFVFFAVLTTYLLFRGLEGKNNKFNFYYLIPGGLLFIFTYFIHEATLILGLGFLIYFLINIKRSKKYKILSIVSLIVLATFFAIHFLVTPLTTNDFFTLRSDPNFQYFEYPFNQLRLAPVVGWLILILGLFLWEKKKPIYIYYLSLFAPIIIYFTFFAQRYAAKKYILFIVPFILIFYADSFYRIFKKIISPKYLAISFIITFLVIAPVLFKS